MLLRFGSGRELFIGIGAPEAPHRGAGLHRLTLPAKLDVRNTMLADVPVTISGHVWLGQHHSDWLGRFATEAPVVTYTTPFDAKIVLPQSDVQLAVIEQRRAGADFMLWLDVDVVLGLIRRLLRQRPSTTGGPSNQRRRRSPSSARLGCAC
jgi:hypothetical protein